MPMPSLLHHIKRRLETPQRGAATLTVTRRDYLMVTYAVPVERVRALVPAGIPLDMLPGPDGERLAFVQTTCFFNENMRWSPLSKDSGVSFYQSADRILTRREGRRGAFYLRSYLSDSQAQTMERAIVREADYGRFSVHIAGDPVKKTYESYTVRVSGERSQIKIEAGGLSEPPAVVPAPFGKAEEMVSFLTQREDAYYNAAVPPSRIGLIPVEHAPMEPVWGELVNPPRLTLWTELGVLAEDELPNPLAVFIQPSLVVTTYPPRLVRL